MKCFITICTWLTIALGAHSQKTIFIRVFDDFVFGAPTNKKPILQIKMAQKKWLKAKSALSYFRNK
ncbi:MAG TPA: hypothetical protein VFH07_10505 [Chitinophagaceae bacterium]|jgi:hypothetical protein|nr:hypothetical protein [Chitinophagaceae bacterium]